MNDSGGDLSDGHAVIEIYIVRDLSLDPCWRGVLRRYTSMLARRVSDHLSNSLPYGHVVCRLP